MSQKSFLAGRVFRLSFPPTLLRSVVESLSSPHADASSQNPAHRPDCPPRRQEASGGCFTERNLVATAAPQGCFHVERVSACHSGQFQPPSISLRRCCCWTITRISRPRNVSRSSTEQHPLSRLRLRLR